MIKTVSALIILIGIVSTAGCEPQFRRPERPEEVAANRAEIIERLGAGGIIATQAGCRHRSNDNRDGYRGQTTIPEKHQGGNTGAAKSEHATAKTD